MPEIICCESTPVFTTNSCFLHEFSKIGWNKVFIPSGVKNILTISEVQTCIPKAATVIPERHPRPGCYTLSTGPRGSHKCTKISRKAKPCCWLYLPFNAKQFIPWSYNPPARSLIHQSNGGFPPPSLEMIWPHENKMNAGSAGYAVPLTSLYFSLNSGLFV